MVSRHDRRAVDLLFHWVTVVLNGAVDVPRFDLDSLQQILCHLFRGGERSARQYLSLIKIHECHFVPSQ